MLSLIVISIFAMKKEKDNKLSLGNIGSLSSLVREVRDEKDSAPIVTNKDIDCEEWKNFIATADRYGKGSAKVAVYIPKNLKSELENLRSLMGGEVPLSAVVSAMIDTFIERNLPIIKELSKESKGRF